MHNNKKNRKDKIEMEDLSKSMMTKKNRNILRKINYAKD